MPVQLVEQLDETDLAGNTTQYMQATFTVGEQSSPLVVRVPFTNEWVAELTSAIESEAQGVRAILSLNP